MLFPVLAAPGAAQTYLPLAVGNHWIYDNEFGFHEEQHVSGTVELFGRMAFVMRYVNSDVNEGLENYWITDASGDLYSCGFYRTRQDFGRVYDPPILWLDVPLAPGKSWTTTSSVFEYPSLEAAGSLGLGLSVEAYGILKVPAGSYEAFGIGQFTPRDQAGSLGLRAIVSAEFALDGRRIDETLGWVGPTYYADGVGVVLYETYALASSPVPTRGASWGRLKEMYR